MHHHSDLARNNGDREIKIPVANQNGETQTCFKCGTEKPLTEFYKSPDRSNGHFGKCKECSKKDVKENYRLRKHQYQAYDRRREQTRHRKIQRSLKEARQRLKHPQKYKARNLVTNSIRDKKLIRKPCEKCGNPKSEAHHDDYSKPLDVRWLCFKHHREFHGQKTD